MEGQITVQSAAQRIAQQAVGSEVVAQSSAQSGAAQVMDQLQKLSAQAPGLSAAQALEILQGQFGGSAAQDGRVQR